jgi:hypothetical protein
MLDEASLVEWHHRPFAQHIEKIPRALGDDLVPPDPLKLLDPVAGAHERQGSPGQVPAYFGVEEQVGEDAPDLAATVQLSGVHRSLIVPRHAFLSLTGTG